MLKLSLEIPTVMLKQWSPLVDLDFCLAHKVLQDKEYGEFFAMRPIGRELILDNSTHEFGKPIPFAALELAANMVQANFVIAPDIVVDRSLMTEEMVAQNRLWLLQAAEDLSHGQQIGGVLNGLSTADLLSYVSMVSEHGTLLCFTFHESNRLGQWHTVKDHILRDTPIRRIHLLGMTSFAELREWVKISEEYQHIEWSFDTSKPLKWGVQHQFLSSFDIEHEGVRGGTVKSKHVLEMKEFDDSQIEIIECNIDYLKAVCRGEK